MFCISRKEQNLDPKQESIPPPAHIEVGNEKNILEDRLKFDSTNAASL